MLQVTAQSSDDTRVLGELLGQICRAGDLILLHGELGAGKTTLTQGIGRALQVDGQVTSPTFIVTRSHSSRIGLPLVHADAYRVQDNLDLETLDLDSSLFESVTVIEWGRGHAEQLSDDRLEIELEVHSAGGWEEISDEPRTIRLVPVGSSWQDRLATDLLPLLTAAPLDCEVKHA